MGGWYGHMDHLYDNGSITFKDIKDVFIRASSGELEGTEKTDGQNIFVTFDVEKQEVLAVRNMTHAKQSGINIPALRRFFTSDRVAAGKEPAPDSVVLAFEESLRSFEEVARSIPIEKQRRMFLTPEGYPIFYNAEVMATENPNVIQYDHDVLLIQRSGHVKLIDQETATAEHLDDDPEEKAIYLKQIQQALTDRPDEIKKQKFRVMINAVTRLQALDDDVVLNNTIKKLEAEQNKLGISDNQSVNEYLAAHLDLLLDQEYKLEEELKSMVMVAMLDFKEKGRHLVSTIKKIVAATPPEQRETIQELMTNEKTKLLLHKAIFPLESLIHLFSVEMLRTLKSFAIIDNTAEAKRLKTSIESALQILDNPDHDVSSKYPKVYEFVRKQLEKISKIAGSDAYDIETAAEGFVFQHDDRTYKFTGNFAPVNQIMGIFQYGRGDTPALRSLKENVSEQDVGQQLNSVVFIPGGFKPPHKGHMSMIGQAAERFKESKIYIVSGGTERDGIGLEHSREIFTLYFAADPRLNGIDIEFITIDEPIRSKRTYADTKLNRKEKKVGLPVMTDSPIQYIINVSSELPPETNVVLVHSTADMGHANALSAQMKELEEENKINYQTYAVDICRDPLEKKASGDNLGDCKTDIKLSASDMRKAVMKGDFKRFADFIPSSAKQFTSDIWHILGGHSKEVKEIGEIKKKSANADDLYGMIEEAIDKIIVKRRGTKGYCATISAPGNHTVINHHTHKQKACCGDYGTSCEVCNGVAEEDVSIEEMTGAGAIAGAPAAFGKRKKKKIEEDGLQEGPIGDYFASERNVERIYDMSNLLGVAHDRISFKNLPKVDQEAVAKLLNKRMEYLEWAATFAPNEKYYDQDIQAGVSPWKLIQTDIINKNRALRLSLDKVELEEISAMRANSSGKRKKKKSCSEEDERLVSEVYDYILTRGLLE